MSGVSVGAIPRRSAVGVGDLDREQRGYDPERKGGLKDGPRNNQDRGDPLGLRDAWIMARNRIKKYTEERKESKKYQEKITGNQMGMKRIKGKIDQMRKDLTCRMPDGNQGSMDWIHSDREETDPPDKGISEDRPPDTIVTQPKEEDQILPIRREPIPRLVEHHGGLKVRLWETANPTQTPQSTEISCLSAMANQDSGKNKAPMDGGEEVDSNGRPGLGSRPLVRGGSSRARSDLYRTPEGQGVGGTKVQGMEGMIMSWLQFSPLTWRCRRRTWLS